MDVELKVEVTNGLVSQDPINLGDGGVQEPLRDVHLGGRSADW